MIHKESIARRTAKPLQTRRRISIQSLAYLSSFRYVKSGPQKPSAAETMLDAQSQMNVDISFRDSTQCWTWRLSKIRRRQGQSKSIITLVPRKKKQLSSEYVSRRCKA